MEPEKLLEIVHEAALLGCMLLFVAAGGPLLERGVAGEFLGLLAGAILVTTGAVTIARAPARHRRRTALRVTRADVERSLAARERRAEEFEAAGITA